MAQYMYLRRQEVPLEFVGDLLHQAAFSGQQLAMPVQAEPATVAALTPETFWTYRQGLLRPKQMYVVGLGVSHNDVRFFCLFFLFA